MLAPVILIALPIVVLVAVLAIVVATLFFLRRRTAVQRVLKNYSSDEDEGRRNFLDNNYNLDNTEKPTIPPSQKNLLGTTGEQTKTGDLVEVGA